MTLIRTFLDDQFEYIWGPDAEPASTEKHANESKNKVERFLAFGDNAAKHLEDITASDIIDFCRAIKREGNLSVKTLNRYRSAIGSLFTAAEKYGTISTDDRPRMDYSKEITQKPRYFTLSEIVQITEYLENQPEQWLLHLFTIGHLTGMRVSEIWRTTKEDLIYLDDEFGFATPHVRVTNTKNGVDREVPLSEEALAAFEAANWEFPKSKATSRYSGGKMPMTTYRRVWAEIRCKIGRGDPRVMMKQTRHTAASALCNEIGANVMLVADILGHKDIKTTQKYVHAKTGTMAGIVGRLSQRVPQTKQ